MGRYGADRPSLEMMDDWICEGYALVAQTKRTEAQQAWWKVWEALRPRLTPDMKDLDEAGSRLFPQMSQCLGNWSGDFLTTCPRAWPMHACCYPKPRPHR